MTIFLKSAAWLLLLGPVFSFSSCRNEQEMREEEQASVVGIEKGVVSELWTSDADGKIQPQKVEKKEEPAPAEEVKPEVPEEIVEEAEVVTQEQPQVVAQQPAPQQMPAPQQVAPQPQSKPEPKPEPKPAAPKAEEKPAPQNSGDTD